MVSVNSFSVIVVVLVILATYGTNSSYHDMVEEGECRKSGYITSSSLSYVIMGANTVTRGYRITAASKHLAYHLGMQLTGYEKETLENLDMWVTRDGIESHADATTPLLRCTSPSSEDIVCRSMATNPHPHMMGNISVTIVWNDSWSNNLLLVLCTSKNKFWLLGSTSDSVKCDDQRNALRVVRDLGFDTRKVLYSYRKCEEDKGLFGSFFRK